MRKRVAPFALLVLVSCLGSCGPIPDSRFAAKPEWTPERYANPPASPIDPGAEMSQDEMIEDIAFLQHIFDAAYPIDRVSAADWHRYARRIPERPATRGQFCWSRKLWSQFDTTEHVTRIGRALAPTPRTAELVQAAFVVAAGCEAGCQMLVSLARSQPRVEIASETGTEDRLSGDEFGWLRLPHSGIEITFPTVRYGPVGDGTISIQYGSAWDSTISGMKNPSGLVPSFVSVLQKLGAERAEARKWASAPLPDCATLPKDPDALAQKRGGCFSHQRNGEFADVIIKLALDRDRTRRFLASCEVGADTFVDFSQIGHTMATAIASEDELLRVAHAPLVKYIEYGCPIKPESAP